MTKVTNMNKRVAITLVICMIFALFTPTVSQAATVSDISNHWARSTIQSWIDDDFISGYPDDSFKPDNNITRAEFMTLVNKSFDYTDTQSISFTDVKSRDWFYNTVKIAREAGYISGYPDGSMRPNNPITREEAATIIMNIKNLESNTYAANIFKDDALMKWSKGAIGAVVDADIMIGYPDGTFKPQNYIKRGEAVVALDRSIELITAPDAPDVTRNDVTNTVSGMTTAMEYKLDSAGWVDYRSRVFSEIDLNGDHTLLVKYAADGDIPQSPSTTLTFTENPLTAIKSIVGTAQVGSELTAGALTPSDATASYQWMISSTKSGTYKNISGATSKYYTPIESDEDKYLKVVATGTGKFTGKVTSVATAAILPKGTITAIGTITGTVKVGTELTAGALTPSGATATYQWIISSSASGTYTNITGATKNKYIPVEGDVGKYLKVTATGSGNFTGTVTSSSSAAVVPKDSLSSISSIIGKAQVGLELIAGTITPSNATASYQWQISNSANGTYSNVAGAITNKYTPTDSDVSKYLRVVATGAGSFTGTVTSAPTAAVSSKEVLISINDIIGNVEVGQELSAGSLTPSNATVSYQWQISDSENGTYNNIVGATTNKYTLKDSDAYKFLRVVVTGTGGYMGTAESDSVEVAPYDIYELRSIGNIIGTAKAGEELMDGIINPSNATVNYQWLISNSSNGSYSEINGATNNKYTLSEEDTGKYLKVMVTGTGSYTGTLTSAPTSAVAQSDNLLLIVEAESKVSAYENALITTLEEISLTESLKAQAEEAVAKITNLQVKSAFEVRIASRAVQIAEAKQILLNP